MRTICLADKLEPKLAEFNAEKRPARRKTPAAEIEEPMRANARIDTDDPQVEKSNRDIEEPNRHCPAAEQELPNRPRDRMESELPNSKKSMMEVRAEMRTPAPFVLPSPSPKMDNVEPQRTKLRQESWLVRKCSATLMCEPANTSPKVDSEEPIRLMPRNDIELPNAAQSKADTVDPARMNDRSDKLDPNVAHSAMEHPWWKVTSPSTVNREPNLPAPRTERVLPTLVQSRMLKLDPKRAAP
jgi:hypothetical protein